MQQPHPPAPFIPPAKDVLRTAAAENRPTPTTATVADFQARLELLLKRAVQQGREISIDKNGGRKGLAAAGRRVLSRAAIPLSGIIQSLVGPRDYPATVFPGG